MLPATSLSLYHQHLNGKSNQKNHNSENIKNIKNYGRITAADMPNGGSRYQQGIKF